jgi:hypothetical protein
VNHEIYLRCHTRILDQRSEQKRGPTSPPATLRYVLLLDTETTIDSKQSLNFGAYQFCEDADGKFVCLEEGLFYSDDLSATQLEMLRRYVQKNNRKKIGGNRQKLKLYSRSAFVEKVMYVAIQANAAIVAFNLPFDLSRLAVEYRVGRGGGKRGWSFVLFRYKDKQTGKWRPDSFRPRIKLIPKDSKAAFIRLAGGDSDQPYRTGHFIDLKTLAWALRNISFSLESACKNWKVPGKLKHVPTGRVTTKEIDYCRRDVRASVGLFNALLNEIRTYPLGGLPPEKAFSAASIAKAFLSTMGITQPEEKFRLDDKTNGHLHAVVLRRPG